MYILKQCESRKEYKRQYAILTRAKARGIDTDLINKFYQKAAAKGYQRGQIIEIMLYAARCGVFGYVKEH